VTFGQLISDALQEIGVIGPGDPLGDDDTATALRYALMMVDTFKADRLMLYTVARTLFNLTAGQQTRTIGTGGNFNTTRPVFIPHIGVIPVGTDYEIPVLPYRTREEWLAEPWKAQTDTYPQRFLYERSPLPLGTLTFWPVPTTAAQLAIALPVTLQTPAWGTEIVFPEGYYELYHTNMVIRLAKAFQATATDEQKAAAKLTLGAAKRMNDQGPPPAQFDEGLVGTGGFDIQSGRTR
jgi:hypothetical protein